MWFAPIRGFLLLMAAWVALVFAVAPACGMADGDEPTAINPFGHTTTVREDALPGCIELSDGSLHPGMIYLTRDKRLQIYDSQSERRHLIPLQDVKQIECGIKREWREKEWKFKETTSDEKMFTGRSYPSREYVHTITLRDDKTLAGPLACIVYLQPSHADEGKQSNNAPPTQQRKAEQYVLNKRNKGELGETLESLVYVKRIRLGKEAMEAGQHKAATNQQVDTK